MHAESYPGNSAAKPAFVGPPRPDETPEPRLFHTLQQLLIDVQTVLYARLRLAMLETQHAGKSLATLVTAALFAAVLLATAWLAAWAVLALLLHDLAGLPLWLSLLILCVSNGLVFFLLVQWIRQRSRALLLPLSVESVRAMAGGPVPGASQ